MSTFLDNRSISGEWAVTIPCWLPSFPLLPTWTAKNRFQGAFPRGYFGACGRWSACTNSFDSSSRVLASLHQKINIEIREHPLFRGFACLKAKIDRYANQHEIKASLRPLKPPETFCGFAEEPHSESVRNVQRSLFPFFFFQYSAMTNNLLHLSRFFPKRLPLAYPTLFCILVQI
jgi:hypothetical protein